MKLQTSLLHGDALAWATAKSLRLLDKADAHASAESYLAWKKISKWDPVNNGDLIGMALSTGDMSLSREGGLWVARSNKGEAATVTTAALPAAIEASGKSHQIAVLRCYAMIKLGLVVDIPDDIIATFPAEFKAESFDAGRELHLSTRQPHHSQLLSDNTPVGKAFAARALPTAITSAEIQDEVNPSLLKYETSHFIINIDPALKRGEFLSKKLGKERSGQLIFEDRNGKLVLSDYDGIFMLPPQVEECLSKNGVDISCINDQPALE